MSPLQPAKFSENLIKRNDLDKLGFDRWVFYPGMLFGARERWWGSGGSRDRPHEGLDLCFYRGIDGQDHSLGEGTQIPVIYEGEVIKIDDDFLGKSVYVCHDIYDGRGNRLFTIYGHTRPGAHIRTGKCLDEGELFAVIANKGGIKAGAPPHLHISIAWVPKSVSNERIDWSKIGDPDMVVLLDPLKIISGRYTVAGSNSESG